MPTRCRPQLSGCRQRGCCQCRSAGPPSKHYDAQIHNPLTASCCVPHPCPTRSDVPLLPLLALACAYDHRQCCLSICPSPNVSSDRLQVLLRHKQARVRYSAIAGLGHAWASSESTDRPLLCYPLPSPSQLAGWLALLFKVSWNRQFPPARCPHIPHLLDLTPSRHRRYDTLLEPFRPPPSLLPANVTNANGDLCRSLLDA